MAATGNNRLCTGVRAAGAKRLLTVFGAKGLTIVCGDNRLLTGVRAAGAKRLLTVFGAEGLTTTKEQRAEFGTILDTFVRHTHLFSHPDSITALGLVITVTVVVKWDCFLQDFICLWILAINIQNNCRMRAWLSRALNSGLILETVTQYVTKQCITKPTLCMISLYSQ